MTRFQHAELSIRHYRREMSLIEARNGQRKRWQRGDKESHRRAAESLAAWEEIARECEREQAGQ